MPKCGDTVVVVPPADESKWPSSVYPERSLAKCRGEDSGQVLLFNWRGGHSRKSLCASYFECGRKVETSDRLGGSFHLPPKESVQCLSAWRCARHKATL